MIEKPYEGRAKVNFDGISLLIKIPSKKNWFIIIFLAAWLGGWFMGETSAINELRSGDNAGVNSFMLFWLFGWTVGGLLAITILLWSLFGQETIEIKSGVLSISKGILDLGLLKKNYDLNNIKNLELNIEPSGMESFFDQKKKIGDFWGFTGGKIRFDYGMKTIKSGIGIDEAEARYLIDKIKKLGYYKEY
jgi:hypothetical protein